MIEELRQLDAGEGAFLRELVHDFLSLSAASMERLETAYAQGDRAGVAGAAHDLKGIAMNMGAAALGLFAHHLEKKGREEPPPALAPEMDRLRALYRATCDALRPLGRAEDEGQGG